MADDLPFALQKRVGMHHLCAPSEDQSHPIFPNPHEDDGHAMVVFVGGLLGIFDFDDCLKAQKNIPKVQEEIGIGALEIVIELHADSW
jgi:hypothetical protein